MIVALWALSGLLMFDPSPLPSASASAPAISSTLPPGWVSAPPEGSFEYARYIRHEEDGTDSQLVAERQVCDCDPDRAMAMLQGVFASIKGTSVQRTSIAACGNQADRLLVTGLDTSKDQKNIEVVMFRSDSALVTLAYTFRYPAPMPDAEAALISLCPTPVSAAHPALSAGRRGPT